MRSYVATFGISEQLRAFQLELIKIFLALFVIAQLSVTDAKLNVGPATLDSKILFPFLGLAFSIITGLLLLYFARVVREFFDHAWRESRDQLRQAQAAAVTPPSSKPSSLWFRGGRFCMKPSHARTFEASEEAATEASEQLSRQLSASELGRFVANVTIITFDLTIPLSLTIYSGLHAKLQ